MRSTLISGLLLLSVSFLTGCNKYIKSGIGGSTDVTLTRNSAEYDIKRLKPVELDGSALFGIPGFGTNNKNKNKGGLIFKFNGVAIGSTPRIAPILTMLGFTYGYGLIAQELITVNRTTTYTDWSGNTFRVKGRGPLQLPFAMAIGLPLAGMTNNLVWQGSAASGLTNQMYYQLVDQNPDVDIFTNPKYKIDYKHRLFTQKATINANVMGATLKLK